MNEISDKQLADFEEETQTLSEIVSAIKNNQSIEFEYHKDLHTNGIRQVNPHNLYHNKDSTKILLDGFQISGDSKTKKLESFKQFDTSFIKSIKVLVDATFSINEKYNRASDRYKNSIIGV